MKRIYVILKDGLGNQMFQYAFARTVANMFGNCHIYLCTKGFDYDKNGRRFSLNHLKLSKDVRILRGLSNKLVLKYYYRRLKQINNTIGANKSFTQELLLDFQKEGIYYGEVGNPFADIPLVKSEKHNVFVRGDFQNLNLWTVGYSFQNELNVKDPVKKKNIELLNRIQSTNSVCLHVRRGDYVADDSPWKQELNVCDENYYIRGMNYIHEKCPNAVFYLFSNTKEDVDYLMNNYHFPFMVIPVENNNLDYEDLQLMSACKHFILSNSTYSFWAQYLSCNTNKIVIAPERWNNVNDGSNIYMKSWTVIKN